MTAHMRTLTWPCEECGAKVAIPGPDGYATLDAYRQECLRIAARHGVEKFEDHPILVGRMGVERLAEIRQDLAALDSPNPRD